MIVMILWPVWITVILQSIVVIIGLAIFKKMGYDEGFEDATQAHIYLIKINEERR